MSGLSFGLALRLTSSRLALESVLSPVLALSSAVVAESAAIGATIGNLSVNNLPGGVTVSSYEIITDDDEVFAIDGTGLEVGASLDYETATSHSVTIQANLSAGGPVTRTFVITVSNVLDAATLNALTLDVAELEEGAETGTVVGALQGLSSGSSISLIDNAGGRFALSGTNIIVGLVPTDYETATSHDIAIRETLADSPNSPRDSVIAVTVTNVTEPFAPVNSIAPVINGTPSVGSTLTVTPGTWDGEPTPALSYQWYADGSPISGATASTYELTEGELDTEIVVRETATNSEGAAYEDSAAVGAVTSEPVLSLGPQTVSENATIGTIVGTFSVSNLAGRTVVSYAITADPDSKFAIFVDELQTDGALDYGTATSHSVTIQATLSDASTVEETFTVNVTEVVTISAPTTAAGSAATDTTPDLDIDLPIEATAGDTLLIQYAVASSGSWSTYVSHVLTSQDIIDDEITIPGVTPLSDGIYDFRSRVERGTVIGEWSNTLTQAVDTVGPTLSSPFGTQTGQTTASLGVTTNEGNGELFVVVTTSATPPTATQIKEGKNHAGTAAAAYGSQSISTTGAKSFLATGLTAAITYYAYFMHEDETGNQSAVSAASSFTTASAYTQTRVTFDGSADYLTYTPNASMVNTSGLTISFWMDIGGSDAITHTVIAHASRISVFRAGTGKLSWSFNSTSNVILWAGSTDVSHLAAEGLIHVAIAFDASGGTGQVYINGSSVARTDTTSPTSGTLHWNRAVASGLFGSAAGASLFTGEIGDLWINNAYLDLSTNINKFISGGSPVSLGSTGQTPTGSSPLVFMGGPMDADDWNAGMNLGTATPTFTMNGAVV